MGKNYQKTTCCGGLTDTAIVTVLVLYTDMIVDF